MKTVVIAVPLNQQILTAGPKASSPKAPPSPKPPLSSRPAACLFYQPLHWRPRHPGRVLKDPQVRQGFMVMALEGRGGGGAIRCHTATDSRSYYSLLQLYQMMTDWVRDGLAEGGKMDILRGFGHRAQTFWVSKLAAANDRRCPKPIIKPESPNNPNPKP